MLGWESVFHCEINPFGRQVLDYYFPKSESYEDITKQDFTKWRGQVDVLTGGFPCQPFSYAGKRRGSEDDRYLWPSMLRCIQEVRPTWFVGENVAGIATMVIPGEDVKVGGQGTLFGEVDEMERRERYVIEEICSQLEGIGYSVQPMLIPACAVGAPHRRDRIFFIAHRDVADPYDGADRRIAREDEGKGGEERLQERDEVRKPDESTSVRSEMQGLVANSDCSGQSASYESGGREGKEVDRERLGEPFNGIERLGASQPAADTMCVGGREVHEQVESRFADGSEPIGDGGERDVANTHDAGLQEERAEQQATMSSRGHPRDEQGTVADTCNRGRPMGGITEGCRQHDSDGAAKYSCRRWIEMSNNPPRTTKDERGGSCETERTSDGYEVGRRWANFPTVSPVHSGYDGLPSEVAHLSIPFSRWRKESLKAYGNAIVVQVMYEIFRAIDIIENGE